MRLDRDRVAAATIAVAVAAGSVGIGWGFWEAHEGNTKASEITSLLREHSNDLKVEQAENRALSGAVLYVEESIAALCESTYHVANCPQPPGAFP